MVWLTIYTKRQDHFDLQTIDAGSLNPYDLFTNNWFSSNNKLNKDFEIYSTELELRRSSNKWTFCNYDDPGIGYPRDCGKNGHVAHTWFSIKRAPQKDLSTFEIYTGDDCRGYSVAPKVEKEMSGLMSTQGATCSSVTHKNFELGTGYYEMVLSELKGSVGFVLSSASSSSASSSFLETSSSLGSIRLDKGCGNEE